MFLRFIPMSSRTLCQLLYPSDKYIEKFHSVDAYLLLEYIRARACIILRLTFLYKTYFILKI